MTSENIWSKMIVARQLSSNYFTILTCLTDILHHYSKNSLVFKNLSETLFSSSVDQIKLLDNYSNILQNIFKQNSLQTNIIQNIRRLFRCDPCLKQLFSTIIDEYCQCHECDCRISNSITDVIHHVDELRTKLLIESSQISCACFRCHDKNQVKTLTFTQFSPCLALTVHRLCVNTKDQLTNAQGIVYDLIYIIEFDVTSCLILNVYQRQNDEFIKVDGTELSNRISTIDSHGNFLTLWISETTSIQNEVDLSSSFPSSQLIPNPSSITFNNNQLSNSNTESSSPASTASKGTSDDDTTSDVNLTLRHSQTEHNHTVNSLATNILCPTIVNQTERHNKTTSLKQLPSISKSKRIQPYTTA